MLLQTQFTKLSLDQSVSLVILRIYISEPLPWKPCAILSKDSTAPKGDLGGKDGEMGAALGVSRQTKAEQTDRRHKRRRWGASQAWEFGQSSIAPLSPEAAGSVLTNAPIPVLVNAAYWPSILLLHNMVDNGKTSLLPSETTCPE